MRALPWIYAAAILAVNLYVSWPALFEATCGHLNSMHGQWMSLAQIAGFDWARPTWWRYWGGGEPLQDTYAPLVPLATAAVMRLFHLPAAQALHALVAVVYCLGPLGLYLVTWRVSRRPGASFAAALIWSLSSPLELLLPDSGFSLASALNARRLMLALQWDELPHLLSLALLPLAVWAMARALQRGRARDFAAAGLALAAMMLANMFGVVLAAIVTLTVPLALSPRVNVRVLARSAMLGAATYVVISPWMTPSLLWSTRRNELQNGEVEWSTASALALAAVVLCVWLAHRWSRRRAYDWQSRWLLLSGTAVIAVPAIAQFTGAHFLPQPVRYKVEAGLAVVWIVVFASRGFIGRMPVAARAAAGLGLLAMAGHQALAFRRAAEEMARPVEFPQTIEYRAGSWVAEHLPGQRVMLGGSLGNFLDTLGPYEQLSAQPYPTGPNWEEKIALYTIYRGENAGDRDAQYSLLWLKAFGVQAVAVPGPASPEYWKPFSRPHKFDGVLPVLWRADDTTIYSVPQSSTALAHTLLPDRLVRDAPKHGLDTAELGQYVHALDTESQPAGLQWSGPNRAYIDASPQPGEVVSTQITYDPGWRASVNGVPVKVRADGLGLMVVEPGRAGRCRIEITFDGGIEAVCCRLASGLCLLLASVTLFRRSRRRSP